MDKLKTKILLISLLLVLLVSLQGVSAVSDGDGNLTSESIDLSICDNTGDAIPEKLSNSPDNILTSSNELDVLGDDSSTYSLLNNEIVNGGNVVELQHDHYTYDYGSTICIYGNNRIIDGGGAVIDMAGSDIRAFNVFGSGVTIKNLTIQNVNNPAAAGAIAFYASGSVTNCNFIGNNAGGIGCAVYFLDNSEGAVANCNFIGNSAGGSGGAIKMYSGSVTNCTFVNNTANNFGGGAILFSNEGHVTNCTFTDNKAAGYGGAVYFDEGATGEIINCNFTNNTASVNGGAVYFFHTGKVTNCNFTGNNAYNKGGAINMLSGTVMKCNFTNNNAFDSGAVSVHTGEVTNCNFVGNKANGDERYGGGAIHMDSGSVENCNFTNNNASYGGAILFGIAGNVTNCNFTGNNATTGSAIYFYSASATKTVSNSRFLNNRANAEALEVTKNDNNITITFTGIDNLLNAIYSNGDVSFTNVTYWGANVIANTGSSPTTPTRSNKEVGQNITVSVVVNDELVLSEVKATDKNGMIVLDISAGENYFICARHETDSYYTEAETINSTMNFSVNVTSQTTGNKTVNLTAKSNIPNEVIDGKLLFIVPSSDPINATYAGNGTWWAVHTFDDYGVHEVNASYTGLDNVTVNNGTVTINDIRLSVVKSANATEVAYNSTVQFTINITNYGPGDAAEVEVSDWLPKGLTFVEAGVINSTGQYEVFDSLDLLILIGDGEFVTFFEFGSGATIEDDGDKGDFAQWSITRIASGNSVILLITARVNGLVMGNITNEVTVKYHENKADSIVNSTNITVIPASSSVKAEDVEVTYGKAIVVAVSSENATGVSYKVIGADGIVKEGTVNVGENITGLDLAAGKYSVNLTTIVLNGNYSSANYTSKITVIPANSSVKAEDVEVTYGDAIVVAVSSVNATGVSYKVIGADGIVKEGTVNVGENITGLDLGADDYTVNLTTMVSGNYTANGYTSKIKVNRANSSISADDVEVTYGETVTIHVSVVNASEFYCDIVNENGTTVYSDIVQAGLNITVENLSAGKYNVTLITGVDSNHTSVRNASRITVSPAGSSVSAEDAVASFGDVVSIPVSSVNATGISYRIIDAKGKTAVNGTVKAGEAIIVSDLASGNYTVSLTTVVDANHTSASNSSKLHIKHVVSIAISPVTGYAGEVVSFTAQFKYENGDLVGEGTAGLTIKYDEREILAASRYSILSADESVPVSNGKATFNVKVENPGKYPYVISYSGGDADDVYAQSTLTILKVNTTVSGIDISGKPADKKNVTVTVLDQDNNTVANGTVTLTLNEKEYSAGVENGKAVLSVVLPNPGSYKATVTYNGNDYYNSSTSSISVDVEKVNTNAPSAEDVSGKAGEKTVIKVKFVDENGNPVKNGTATLTVDGKTYTAEVTNGVATFRDVVIPDKDTVVDVYYQGNDYYNASSTTLSIKVKHDNNTNPDSNNTDENRTKHVSSNIVDGNATGNPIALMLVALFVMVITYRKK